MNVDLKNQTDLLVKLKYRRSLSNELVIVTSTTNEFLEVV